MKLGVQIDMPSDLELGVHFGVPIGVATNLKTGVHIGLPSDLELASFSVGSWGQSCSATAQPLT